jgi:hypothetical protein
MPLYRRCEIAVSKHSFLFRIKRGVSGLCDLKRLSSHKEEIEKTQENPGHHLTIQPTTQNSFKPNLLASRCGSTLFPASLNLHSMGYKMNQEMNRLKVM